jgi:LysM repeat protein
MDAGKQSALLSFGYNFGPAFYGNKDFSKITADLKNKNWENVPNALKLYNKGGGKVLGGLVTRREMEGKMWKEGSTSTPSPKTTTPTKAPQQPTTVSPQPTPMQQVPTKAPVAAPTQAPAQAPAPTSTHEVVKGDTLGAIAKKYKTTVQDIQKLNPDIKDPNSIKPGQKIKTK